MRNRSFLWDLGGGSAMKVAVVVAGNVRLASVVCLADFGHDVVYAGKTEEGRNSGIPIDDRRTSLGLTQ